MEMDVSHWLRTPTEYDRRLHVEMGAFSWRLAAVPSERRL
jgi:hypothetical protein